MISRTQEERAVFEVFSHHSSVNKVPVKTSFILSPNRIGRTETMCFLCHKPGHLACEFKSKPTEGGGCDVSRKIHGGTKHVTVAGDTPVEGQLDSLTQFLYSSDEETAGVSVVRVTDKVASLSVPRCKSREFQPMEFLTVMTSLCQYPVVPTPGVLTHGGDLPAAVGL